MLTDGELAFDIAVEIGNDVKGDAEIACPIDLVAVAIPRAPESSLWILPFIDKLSDPRLHLGHTPWQRLIDMSANSASNVGSPVASEVKAAETGDYRIQRGPQIFSRCRNIRDDQAFHRSSEIPNRVDLRIEAECILWPFLAAVKVLESSHCRVQALELPPIAGAPSPVCSRL